MPKNIQEVWDPIKLKVLVYVQDGKGLVAFGKKAEANPCLLVQIGKTVIKTVSIKNSTDPEWNELMYFPLKDEKEIESAEISIECRDEKKGKFMGLSPLGKLKSMPRDRVCEFTCVLEKRRQKDVVRGQVRVRIFVSGSCEQLTDPLERNYEVFNYAKHAPDFKPGDLILFGDHGIIPAATKLIHNSPYSSVGIVVALANLWTTRLELYVVEFTKNINGMLDAFSETKNRNGINIFRLFERIHQHHGSAIAWSSLKVPLDIPNQQKLVEEIWSWHANPDPFEFAANLPEDEIARFTSKEFGFSAKKKTGSDLTIMYSGSAIASILKATRLDSAMRKKEVWHAPYFAALSEYAKPVKIKSTTADKPVNTVPSNMIKPPETVGIYASATDPGPRSSKSTRKEKKSHSSSKVDTKPIEIETCAGRVSGEADEYEGSDEYQPADEDQSPEAPAKTPSSKQPRTNNPAKESSKRPSVPKQSMPLSPTMVLEQPIRSVGARCDEFSPPPLNPAPTAPSEPPAYQEDWVGGNPAFQNYPGLNA